MILTVRTYMGGDLEMTQDIKDVKFYENLVQYVPKSTHA